ncbi:hypothetical protein ABFX02_10G063300 [Erythranthe guttata]
MGLFSNKIKRNELHPGDHIYTWRRLYIYAHHGIYIGDDTVIHYTSTSMVESLSLETFLDGGNLYRFEYSVSSKLVMAKVRGGTCTTNVSDAADEVIRRAKYLLENEGIFGAYNLIDNNCENFSVYCKTGLLDRSTKGHSGQIASLACSSGSSGGGGKKWFGTPLVNYSKDRYKRDTRMKTHGVKVAVEDLKKIPATRDL